MYAEILRSWLSEVFVVSGMVFVSGAIIFTLLSLAKTYLNRKKHTI